MSDEALEALRAQGAHLHDPVRFRYLEAMAARMRTQPAQVRQVLAGKLNEAVDDYRSRVRRRMQDAPASAAIATAPASAKDPRSSLAQLNRHIAERMKATHIGDTLDGGADAGAGFGMGTPSDMKSVRRFAETWSRIATERQLAQALTRGPEAAGPLNSHNLMLRAMSLMNGLSPDYLRRFLAQADALLWLDQMNQHHALKDGKAVKRARAKK